MRRASLRTRWTLTLLGAGALPLLLFAGVTLELQRRRSINAEQELEISITDHASEVIDRVLGEAAEATHRAGRLLTEPSIENGDARLALAREMMARAEALRQVAVYTPDGKLLDAIGRKQDDDDAPAPPDALPDALLPASLGTSTITSLGTSTITSLGTSTGMEGRWLAPVHDMAPAMDHPGASRFAIRYLEPILREGQRRALVLGTLDGAFLDRRLQEISRDRFYGRSDGLLLLDGQARVLAGGGGGALSVGQSLLGRDVFLGKYGKHGLFTRPFAMVSAFRAGDGEEMVGSVRSLQTRGWAVVVRRASREVFAGVARTRLILLGTAAGLFGLAIFLGAFIAARTTRPIRSLVELTRAFSRREFAARSTVHTGDELEELGESMTQMAQSLQQGEGEIARRAAVEADLSRYLPAEVARSIAEGKRALALGGERRTVSVLFADVVSFTTFAEGSPPERVVAFLNELFTVLTEVIFRHGGTVDKFIGDCIMVIFGAPADQPDHAARALAAAEDIHRFVEFSAPAWKQKYGADIRLGVGVNSGVALVGNLGSESRMEYTAIGDVVNVASRVEGMARPGQTLCTAAVAALVGDAFLLISLGEHPLRGKQKPVEIFELG